MMDITSLRVAVEKAKPFIDAGARPNAWRASELIVMGWCMIASSRSGEAADEWANSMLDEARSRYAAGFYADPFREPVEVRPA